MYKQIRGGGLRTIAEFWQYRVLSPYGEHMPDSGYMAIQLINAWKRPLKP